MEQGKKAVSRLGWCFLAAALLIEGISYLISMVKDKIPKLGLSDTDFAILLSAVIMYLIVFPLVVLFLKKKVPVVKPVKKKISVGKYLVWLLMCMGIAYSSNFLGLMITTIVGIAKGSAVENTVINVTTSASPAMVLLYMVILAPIMEELIFRKLIVDRLVSYGPGIAIVVSGLMFGLFHGNLNQFAYALFIGMFFAFVYVKTGDIRISISMHMIFNFNGGFVSSFLMKKIDFDTYLKLVSSGDSQQMTEYVMDNIGIFALYGIFLFVILGAAFAGVILFIVFLCKGEFKFAPGAGSVPRGQRFSTVFMNAGMLFYIAYWMIQIIVQLVAA